MRKRIIIVSIAAILIVVLVFMLSTDDGVINPQSLDAQNRQDVLQQSNEGQRESTRFKEDRMKSRRVVPVIRSKEETARAPSPYALPGRSRGVEDESTWEDPVNQKVLGEKRWMAQPSDETIERIESVLNQERVDPEARAMRNQDRRSAIETVRVVVDDCVQLVRDQHPEAIGRVSIAFDFDTTGAIGMIKNGRIGQVWKLDEYPGFVSCVERGVAGLEFESRTSDTVMEVEYPFFYEGE